MFSKIKKFMIDFQNKKPYVFWLLVFSFVLAALPFLYCLITFFTPNKLYGTWVFFIPFFVILIISLLSFLAHKKFPKLSGFVAFCINIFIVLYIQIFAGLIVLGVLYGLNQEYMNDKPEYYEKVIERVTPKDRVKHFPNHIPQNAKNIVMDASIFSFFGSLDVFLKFDIDKTYIENELKQYKFKSIQRPDMNNFGYVLSKMGTSTKTYDVYIINGELRRRGDCYGIAVNQEKNQIIYFYLDPD